MRKSEVKWRHKSVRGTVYCNNPKYWNRQARENRLDQDQTPQNAASDQGLHCLPLVQQYIKHIGE